MASVNPRFDEPIYRMRGLGLRIVTGSQLITGATSAHIATGHVIVSVLSAYPGAGSSTQVAMVRAYASTGGSTLYMYTTGTTGDDNYYDWAIIAQ